MEGIERGARVILPPLERNRNEYDAQVLRCIVRVIKSIPTNWDANMRRTDPAVDQDVIHMVKVLVNALKNDISRRRRLNI